jgi:hypothetical protein
VLLRNNSKAQNRNKCHTCACLESRPHLGLMCLCSSEVKKFIGVGFYFRGSATLVGLGLIVVDVP